MSAERLLDACRAAGIKLQVDGADLFVEADRDPPPELVSQLRGYKAELIAMLRSELTEPLLLRDGRRLWRFPAETRIPRAPSPHLAPLIEYAREFGAVLVADGGTLIVVEKWQSNLPPETLHNLRAEAAGIIACLRGESRERTKGD